MALFMYLKIILLQYFQFSTISNIQTEYTQCLYVFHFSKIWVWSLLHDIKYTLYSLRSLFDSFVLISVILNCVQRLQGKSLIQRGVSKMFLIFELGHNQSDATGGCKTDKVNNGKSLVSTSTGTC